MFSTSTTSDRPEHRSAKWLWTGIIAVLMLGLVALNAPVTFAGAGGATATIDRLTQQTSEATIADVAESANLATVTVINLQEQMNSRSTGQDDPVAAGSGSGYIIDADGHVVTNNHVVEGGVAFQVQFIDGTVVDATLVGADPYQDVAVLKLELTGGQALPGIVSFGDSDSVRAGDEVIAIGSPYGEYTNTVSTGNVNAVDRSLDTGTGYAMPNLIQHDAAIYPGNSGGPLFNLDGEVIGMNVAKAVNPTTGYPQEDSSFGFAIEGNAVKVLVDEIIETGKVARPYLGIYAESAMSGVGVVEVEPDGPAAEAGLQVGDIIETIDGNDITQRNPFINQLIFDHKPGDEIDLVVDRNGEQLTITVTLAERPAEMQ